MNYYALQSIFTCFLSIFIGFYVFEKSPQKLLNRLFLGVTVFTAYLSFAEYGYRISGTVGASVFWYQMTAIWPFVIALSFQLVLVFTGYLLKIRSGITRLLVYFFLYFPALILSISEYIVMLQPTTTFLKEEWGWERSFTGTPTYLIFSFLWFLAVITIELAICYHHLHHTRWHHKKQQTMFFIIGLSIPLVTMLISGILFPYLKIRFPEMSTTGLMLGILFMGYGIRKYHLFNLTPEAIAQTIIRNMSDAFLLLDSEKNVVYVNRAALNLLGIDEMELIGQSINSVMSSHNINNESDDVLKLFDEKDYLLDFETTITSNTSLNMPVSISAFVQREKDGLPIGYVMLIRDNSTLKKTEKELIASEEKLRTVLESVMEGYYEVDLQGRFLLVNNAYSEITGYTPEELKGKSYEELVSSETAKRLYRIFNNTLHSNLPEKNIRFKLIKKSGQPVILEMSTALIRTADNQPSGFSGLTRDVTDKTRLEEMIIQTEKMMSIGGLAAGIAHEINNPLAGMVQTIQVVKNRTLGDIPKNREVAQSCGIAFEKLKEYLSLRDIPGKFDTIMEAGGRIADIVDNMLSFSRKGNTMFGLHDLKELLDKTISLVSNEYELKKKYNFKNIKIIKEYDESMPRVPCEGSKLQQVFFNLLKNGAQAMSENKKTDKECCFFLRINNADGFARIEIEDTGPGMDEAVKKQIFEPFFTTKEAGKGTGLGLSISNFIISENHHGYMKVESEPGKGTKFILQLPLISEDIVVPNAIDI
ncbi:PAS domain S-box protein [bacterium]|nr:PAS domain S-box protein [bacterium]